MNINVVDKKECVIDDIINLVSFDKFHFSCETTMGIVTIKGENIEISNINNNDNIIKIVGIINSIILNEVEIKKSKGKSFIKKLFK